MQNDDRKDLLLSNGRVSEAETRAAKTSPRELTDDEMASIAGGILFPVFAQAR